MAIDPQEVADILDGLDSPSPDEVYHATKDYDTNYIVAAVGSKAYGPGGGSSTIKVVDCGVLETHACGAEGPQTLYTPAAGEIIYGVILLDWTPSDESKKTLIGSLATFEANGGNEETFILGFFDNDVLVGTHVPYDATGAVNPEVGFAQTDALVGVWLTVQNSLLVNSAPGTWQADHAYAQGDWLIDSNGDLQYANSGGVSGSAEPVWDTSGGLTDDGTVQWSDERAPDAAGSAHVYALVALPAAP